MFLALLTAVPVCTFPHVPFSTYQACFLNYNTPDDLSGILPAETPPIPLPLSSHQHTPAARKTNGDTPSQVTPTTSLWVQ